MAKKSDGGCATLGAIAVIVFAIGKCSGGPSPAEQASQSLFAEPGPAAEPSSAPLYVLTRSLKCRATASRNAAIVAKYVRSDMVSITDYSGDWALVPQGGTSGCWVARQNLGENPPQAAAVVAPALPLTSPSRTRLERNDSGETCGSKWKCGQMDSCEEANYYLNQCELGRLDGDGDGVPCESIC